MSLPRLLNSHNVLIETATLFARARELSVGVAPLSPW
jgi:hypothetical protein